MSWEPWGNCGAAGVAVSGGPWPERQGRWDWQASACGSGGQGWPEARASGARGQGIWGLGAFFLT